MVDDTSAMVDDSSNGIVDWSHLATGTQAIEVVSEREVAQDQMEAFMRELLVIELHDTTDKNAPIGAEVGVNGQKVFIPRCKKIRIPRAFVENLARSQPIGWRTENVRDPSAEIGTVPRRSKGASFAFTVHHDPNPVGRRWLERVIREG